MWCVSGYYFVRGAHVFPHIDITSEDKDEGDDHGIGEEAPALAAIATTMSAPVNRAAAAAAAMVMMPMRLSDLCACVRMRMSWSRGSSSILRFS